MLQLKLEAYLGSGFMGDVAVDDVVVASGGCAVHPKEAARNATYIAPASRTYTELPPTTPALGPYDCFFEVDLCSWSSSVDEVRICPHTQPDDHKVLEDLYTWIFLVSESHFVYL